MRVLLDLNEALTRTCNNFCLYSTIGYLRKNEDGLFKQTYLKEIKLTHLDFTTQKNSSQKLLEDQQQLLQKLHKNHS